MENHYMNTFYPYEDTDLTSNMEDYIETIANLAEEHRVVRVKDIAKKLSIKMPSVTAALNKLKEMELIEYEKYGFIELTPRGKSVADQVCQRHRCLSDFFEKILHIERESADEVACRVEHTVSPEVCQQIHRFLDFYVSEKKKGSQWVGRLEEHLSEGD